MKNEREEIKVKIFRFLILPFYFLLFTSLNFAQTPAPGAPGKDAQWSSAGKQAIGTSASLESKVWFTLQNGALSEVYYPDVTVANVHKLEFVVVNPKTKKVETETEDANHSLITEDEYYGGKPLTPQQIAGLRQAGIIIPNSKIKPEDKLFPENSLQFIQFNTAKSGKWKIKKRYIADTENNTILVRVFFESTDKNLELYVYYDPSLGNTGMHDIAWNQDKVLLAQDKDKCSALIIGEGRNSEKITDVSSGFYQTSDGLEQLQRDGKLSTPYSKAENGNVVQIAKISSTDRKFANFTLSLGFGNSPQNAFESASKSLKKGFDDSYMQFVRGWNEYIKTIPKVEPKYQAQFNMAAMVMKAQEDKTVRGANVASLTIPWGGGATANEDIGGGYHLVWSRDLYQVVTAYMALGDMAAANRALDFLFNIQQKPDGSFPQNSWLDGKQGWGSLQLDEVAYPLIMAYQLKRFDKKLYENHIKKAADFLVKTGPKTPQERWEEKSGYSPSTIAAEIAGLVCAADIAKRNGDETSATLYLKTADDWAVNVEKWTATTNGKYGDGNYYVRLTENGKPDEKEKTVLSNNAGTAIENEIVDAGFLELVRLGIKSPDDPLIVKSVKVIDQTLRVNTPNGESFYRYTNDGYGEMDDGRRWNWDGKYTGKGRLWALLTGERGQYELAMDENWVREEKEKRRLNPDYPVAKTYREWRVKAKSRLDAMANFANDGLMIPEQIWDNADVPKNIDKQFIPELKFGEGTGSATPLAWSMAQFIRLAVNLQAGKNLDTPDIVYERYVKNSSKKGNINAEIKIKKDGEYLVVRDYPYRSQIFYDFGKGLQGGDVFLARLGTISNMQSTVVIPQGSEKVFVKLVNADGSTAYQNFDLTEERKKFEEKKKSDAKIVEKIKKSKIQPFIENRKAYFLYEGKAENVQIASDFTEWKPLNKFEETGVENQRLLILPFASSARVEYKIVIDGNWIPDPKNPNKIDNGVGSENSFFTMPEYRATNFDKGEAPKLEEIQIDSGMFLIGRRKVQIYLPPKYLTSKSDFPVLYLQDGSDYKNRAKAIQIQQNLVAAGKIQPFIIVFTDAKERNIDYWASDDYAKFLATEVVPAIDAKYKTTKSRDGRAILGASLGGVTSVHAGVKYPEVFGRVGGQSSSFWIDNERVVKELETLDASRNKFRFYFDVGILEGADDDRKAVEILRKKGFDVVYQEAETGHNWTSWRDRLADAFVALWSNAKV